jgi:putative nucleotidyltransferase with HDIG domain
MRDQKDQLLEQKLGSIENLPTVPLVLRQVQKVVQNPSSSMDQIAAVVAKDQALASRTIRLVNSAFYGMRERVTSISHAIVVLGLNTLNNLMIGLSVVKLFKNSKFLGFDPEKFWEHSFGTALIARALAKDVCPKDGETAFISGLLHDMGRMVLDQNLHDEFSKSLFQSRNEAKPLYECEKAVLGFDHADAGAWLGRKWGLPDALIAGIGYHHQQVVPEKLQDHAELARIIGIANRLSLSAGIGASGDQDCRSSGLCPVEGKSGKQIQEMIDSVRNEIRNTIDEWNKAM